MCRYAAMKHKSGNECRQDAITYHEKRLPWGKRGQWLGGRGTDAAAESGVGGVMMSQIGRDRNQPKAGRDVSKIREPQ